jgi:hypothetical protein
MSEEEAVREACRVGDRLADRSASPGDEVVRAWIGTDAFEHWTALRAWIERSYPGVFVPEWLYGGRKHGWSLRYKTSRAFCTLLPEYRLFSVVVVLGAAEREKLSARRGSLSASLVGLYDSTATYHDGKWLKIGISSLDDLRDATEVLTIKRPGRFRERGRRPAPLH